MSIDPINLTRELIDIPSVTGEEMRVGEHLERTLDGLGLSCTRQPVEGDRFNLLATASVDPIVLFCTHIDTVPPFIESSEDAEWIHGRGACDAKGILAAMIAAADQLLSSGERRFGFLLVVGEETDSIGAKRANEARLTSSRYVIVGEPTESQFVRACKGAVTAKVRFSGVAAHSAYPERGESAIRKLGEAIVAIESAGWGETADLGRATANVGVVRGGRKPNVIPDEAELELLIRTVEPRARVEERIRRTIEPAGGEVVEIYGGDPIHLFVPSSRESVVVAFGTDAPYLGNYGKRLLFGPGSILDAHRPDEKIRKSEILSAAATYRDLVIELLR